MKITANVRNAGHDHRVAVTTEGDTRSLAIPSRASGPGSGVNGGEFLMLALATCDCNDIYREAERSSVPVGSVEVEAQADFAGIGIAATNISYRARIVSTASHADIDALLRRTDAVAEVQNTLRAGAKVTRHAWEAAQPARREGVDDG
ncbi:hypothetical protein BURK1_03599 [Burkholderiales bacterium]|nr:hypothetical protein BURK1_03599 [Burkholderiales bacterium]